MARERSQFRNAGRATLSLASAGQPASQSGMIFLLALLTGALARFRRTVSLA